MANVRQDTFFTSDPSAPISPPVFAPEDQSRAPEWWADQQDIIREFQASQSGNPALGLVLLGGAVLAFVFLMRR